MGDMLIGGERSPPFGSKAVWYRDWSGTLDGAAALCGAAVWGKAGLNICCTDCDRDFGEIWLPAKLYGREWWPFLFFFYRTE